MVATALWGCRDEGLQRYEEARAKHQALLAQGRPLTDPPFQEVLEALRAVDPTSSAAPKARQLAQVIEQARAPLERPLAGGGSHAVAPGCEGLAQALGQASAEERPKRKDALAQCQRRLDQAREAAHPHAP